MNRLPILICALMLATTWCAAADTTWRAVDSDLWIPIPPEAPAERARFGGDDPLDARRWSWLAPGDTLRFAVRGEGTLRVETRPLFRTDAARRRYRLGVFTAPDVERKLIRRSAFEADAVVAGDTLRVGEVDRWETPLLEDSEEIRLTLREERSAPLLARVLVRGEVRRPAHAEDDEAEAMPGDAGSTDRPWSVEIAAASVGYDGNAYLTPSDSSDVRDAWYWPVELDVDVTVLERGRFELEADYRLDVRQYDDEILDETRHLVRLRQTFDDLEVFGGTRLRLEQRLRSRDRTFFGRGEFVEFETGSDVLVDERLSLADRFDWTEGLLSAEARIEPDADWEITIEGAVLRRDYTEDFSAEPGIWSLDQWRHGGELTLEYEFVEDWSTTLETGFEVWDYDEKFSRDPTGELVSGRPTLLHRRPLSLGLDGEITDDLDVALELGALWTDDQRDDYWTRVTWSSTFEAEWATERWSVDGRVRYSYTDYENATLDLDDPLTPVRTKDSLRLRLESAYRWTDHLSTTVRWDRESLDNDNRRFAYDRDVIEAALRLQW